MSLHPRILRVALGIVGFLSSGTTVEAAVVSLKAVKKNNVAIAPTNNLPVLGGDTIEAEILLSGWGNELPLGVSMYWVTLDGSASFASGTNGTILPLGWCGPVDTIDCTVPATCPPEYPVCLTLPPTGCMCTPHDPTLGWFITTTRPNFLFFGQEQPLFPVEDPTSLDYEYFGIATDSAVPDTGVPRYLGTLILKVSANACGTFTIGFVEEIESTFIADLANNPSLPALQPLLLTVSDCSRQLLSCSPGHCNIDARIAHDRLDPNIKKNAFQMVMTFSKSTTSPAMTAADFEVTVVPFAPDGEDDDIRTILALTPNGTDPKITTLILNRRIRQARWTCVRHLESERQCCMGSLPGDADDDRVRQPADSFEVFDNLQGGVIPALKIEKCDIDRSLMCTPADLLMVVDLLNDPWICGFLPCEDTLPVCPSIVSPP